MGAESKKGDKEEAENKSGPEEDVAQEVVLKVDMHCEACAKKVAKSLRGFKGVEQVSVDCKANKVVVKAAKEVDPLQLQDRLHKKSGRKVDLLSPLPTPTIKPGSDDSNPVVVEDPPKKDEAPPPPPVTTTVVLQVGMHCEACAQALRRRIRKIKGVESVETDVGDDRVTVKGVIEDPDKLAELIHKRTRKHASVVKPAEPKGEDQKPPEKQQHTDEESAQGEAAHENKDDNDNNQNQDQDDLLAKSEHCPTRAYMEYYYSNAPQLFSDENPNACTVM